MCPSASCPTLLQYLLLGQRQFPKNMVTEALQPNNTSGGTGLKKKERKKSTVIALYTKHIVMM